MAKRKTPASSGPTLYEHHERALERRIRRQRALFIPRFLTEAAANHQLAGADQDRAFEVALHWAQLESTGYLAKQKETSIDTQFLDQLFGVGLGYRVKTASPTDWHLEHKYTVPGVGTADAALGEFPSAITPSAVVELKDALTDLDRDRFNGRTAVQQCWDYLNALPGCPWGIVSNFVLIRLYHRDKGVLSYEEFSLQELRSRSRFNEFYCLFERGGLLRSKLAQQPRALALLERTAHRQQQVGDDLYRSYHLQRLRLIEHLQTDHGKPLDTAIRIAQKLLDRVIFIAFCEKRGLLSEDCLQRAGRIPTDSFGVKNPRWRKFLGLFAEVDRGGELVGVDRGYNGNLFKPDPEVDTLDLDDVPWTEGFQNFGIYDFSEEVNVEVLGHIFERSVTELEKLRVGGLFALKAAEAEGGDTSDTSVSSGAIEQKSLISRMPKSAQRKRFGIYYTPPAFTGLIVERTIDALVAERFATCGKHHNVDPEARSSQDPKRLLAYWMACLDALKALTVCDAACGSGAFLIRAYDALDAHYKTVMHGLAGAGLPSQQVLKLEGMIPDLILDHNIYGADLSREAVEITQLALWIRSARRGKTLADLSKHIVCGNSLVADVAIDPRALDWPGTFPTILGSKGSGGFSCVIGNPPWERVKVQDREFFSLTDPTTAEAVSAADRRNRIAAMPHANPELYASYEKARQSAQRMLDYARKSGRYPLTGKGDVNTYMLFAELARSLVAPDGLVGLLVPSGIATDDTTKEFFNALMADRSLISLYDFENRNKVFEDVDSRFKFSALVFGGRKRVTDQADFVFFAHDIDETAAQNKQRHVELTAADLLLLNPNTKTCPIFRTRRDAEITRLLYRRIPILLDHNRRHGGNPWGVRFFTMFHQTNDADHFHDGAYWKGLGYKLVGNRWIKGRKTVLPLYEAKMIQAYDHRAASVIIEEDNWVRQGQKSESTLVDHQNPEFSVLPRWWVEEAVVDGLLRDHKRPAYLCYKDITSATNERTMIAAFVPKVGIVNSAPVILVDGAISNRLMCCLLGNLNSLVYDFVARQKVGGNHLNFFIVEQLPTIAPDEYVSKCPWSKRETLERWISERVLRLSCTSDDMRPFAVACQFDGTDGGGVQKWRDVERLQLRAELDAAYAHLYQISEDEFAYMLSTFSSVPDPVLVATRNAYRDLAMEMSYAR